MKALDKEKLLQEVRDKGVEINSINDLMYINMKHRDLVPILLKHLQEVDDEDDKEFLARCLGIKGFTEVSEPLIQEFCRSNNRFFKWAIGNTLSIVRDKDSLPKLLKIVQEKEHGTSRQMIVLGLGYYKEDEVKKVLVKLLDDDDVAGHAVSALRRIGDPKMAKYIEPFTTHKMTWIRNEAKKAMQKFEKAKQASES